MTEYKTMREVTNEDWCYIGGANSLVSGSAPMIATMKLNNGMDVSVILSGPDWDEEENMAEVRVCGDNEEVSFVKVYPVDLSEEACLDDLERLAVKIAESGEVDDIYLKNNGFVSAGSMKLED